MLYAHWTTLVLGILTGRIWFVLHFVWERRQHYIPPTYEKFIEPGLSDLYNKIAGLGAKHLVNVTYYYVILLIADRAKKISEELLKLWEKLSFPVISQQQVLSKVD